MNKENVINLIKNEMPELEKLGQYLIDNDICFYVDVKKQEAYGCEIEVRETINGVESVFSKEDKTIKISSFGHFDRAMYEVETINHPDLGKFMISYIIDGYKDEIMIVNSVDLVIKFFDNMVKLKQESNLIK